MHVAIDYTPAIAQTAGIGRYTRSLVEALAHLKSDDSFTLFSSEQPVKGRDFPTAANIRPRVFGVGNRVMTILWQRLRVPLPAELLMGRADVLHGPDFILPPVLRARRVVTIHDLAFLTHPECALPSLAAYLSRVTPRAIQAADRVIAVSQRTADDIVERYHTPREKITVIHLGIDSRFTPIRDEAAIERIRSTYDFKQPTILAVGTIEPRKNYERLIAAFAQARHVMGGPQKLVIAGRKGWLYEGVFAAAEHFHVSDAVRFLDFVPDADLPTLYQAADALAMPSLYEGFGIPAVEAMACGTPVVCAATGALPEVVGDAAIQIAPEDINELAEALVRIVHDSVVRERLIACGLEQAAKYNWEAAARAHLRVYAEAAQR